MKKNEVLALMTGHGTQTDGSWDPGCVYGKYTEAALCQAITKVAVKYLRAKGMTVISDSDKKNNRNMISCVSWANSKKAKYYISVHCDYSGASKGVYPLYTSSSGGKMAKSLGKSVAKSMGMKYKGAAKRNDLYELNATDMTAVIFECGAIKADLKYLKDADKYGKALAKAILAYTGPVKGGTGITLPARGYFKNGDSGSNVKILQKYLKSKGYDPGEIDGEYGPKTIKAVKRFQKANKLEQDGLFGEDCLAKA